MSIPIVEADIRASEIAPATSLPPSPTPAPSFVLTSPPVQAPSRDDFVIAEMERRFGGHVVRKSKHEEIGIDPEMYAPSEAEPEWEHLGCRGQVGKLLWARGLRKKAVRFVSCNKRARSGLCSRYPEEHKYYIPNGCEVVFCGDCADEVRRELFHAYHSVIVSVIKKLDGVPKGWVLAQVNFTLRSDGTEITPGRVKAFNSCVRTVMRATVGSPNGYGMLFVDEVGREKRGHLPDSQRVAHGLNLHCHGLYLGPRVDWKETRDLWIAETKKRFGAESRGFYIQAVRGFTVNPEGSIRWALNYMLKYISKPPAVTPERLASLIAAFHGARRVHSLGLFYGKKPQCERGDCHCPKCKAMGITSVVGFEGRPLPNGGYIPRVEPIEDLRARGYVPLREAGRDAVLSTGASREDSWGASP